MVIDKRLNDQQLEALCAILGDILTGSEIFNLLEQCSIIAVDKTTKRVWLYNCFMNEIAKWHSFGKVYEFIEAALNPIRYTRDSERERYAYLFDETNKVLSFAGLSVGETGKVTEIASVSTLDEADRRVSALKKKLVDRDVHIEVQRYCIKDFLRKDYYDAEFEAAKGLAERIRKITGLNFDGGELFQKAFSKEKPFIVFKSSQVPFEMTPNERNEFTGLKELLEAIFHLVRNPAAHTPKINWKTDETKALDILTIISFGHKYLDACQKAPESA